MHSYRIHNLSAETSAADRQLLFDKLRAVDGVESVVVTAERGEISISSAKGDRAPERAALAQAVAAAGFVLRGRADRWTG